MRVLDTDERAGDGFETARAPAPRTMTPRTLTARRPSFTAMSTSVAAAAAAPSPAAPSAVAGQGSFVAPYSMPRDEQVAYLELAKSFLPELVAECARSDSRPSSAAAATASAKWRRLKATKKNSDIHVWETGSNDVNSSSSAGDPSAVNQTYAVRSTARVPAPLDVVLKTLDCSAVTTYRSFTKIIYENLVADTTVLFHSQSATAASPTEERASPTPPRTSTMTPSTSSSPCSASESLAVRWLVCRCNNPMVSDCDMCLLEYAKVTSVDDVSPHHDGLPLFTRRTQNNSSRSNNSENDIVDNSSRATDGLHDRREFPSAYKIVCSIETKSCPELLDSHRLARCVVPLGGFLFYPTDNADATDVVFYMSIAPSSSGGPSGGGNPFSVTSSSERQFRATQRVLQHMARGVGRIKNAVDAYTMSLRLEMLRNTRWVRNTERAECVVCYRRFHQLTRRRHHCRLCGDVICRDCSVYKDADMPTIGPTVLRICKLCDLNELKGSAGSAAAAASSTAAATAASRNASNNDNSNNDAPVARKRSTTLSVDTTKAAVRAAQQEHEVGRRNTTVLDSSSTINNNHRSHHDVPSQVFSSSKADIASRSYKWNTGGGGKPLVVLSPSSAAMYAIRTGGGGTPNNRVASDVASVTKGFAKAMTPTGKRTMPAPQDWCAAVHPLASSTGQHPSNQLHAKSCSKPTSSAQDRFVTFDKLATRGKSTSVHRAPAAAALNQDSNEREEKIDGQQQQQQQRRATRVIKDGKLIVLGDDHKLASPHESSSSSTKKPSTTTAKPQMQTSNQQRELRGELSIRKLQRIDAFEDILLSLCEQVATALATKFAAVSIFTVPSPQQPLTPSATATLSPPIQSRRTGGGGSLPPSPIPSGPLETVHFLKAHGSKRLTKVAAALMCCTPVLERKEQIVTRDALASGNTFDFKRLPIVLGPQQVRFYAGIPIVDANGLMVGALAVFDANVYEDKTLGDVLPTMASFASMAMSAIENRKADLQIKSFLQHPLVDTTTTTVATAATRSYQTAASRHVESTFDIDLILHSSGAGTSIDSDCEFDDVDCEYPAATTYTDDELDVVERYSHHRYPLSPSAATAAAESAPPHGVEYFQNQMEQLVQQARETEAQLHETSMAMKRQGVASW